MVTLTDKYLIPSLLFSQKLPLSSQLVKKKKKKKMCPAPQCHCGLSGRHSMSFPQLSCVVLFCAMLGTKPREAVHPGKALYP